MFDFNSDFFSAKFWMELTVWGIIWGWLATNVAAYGSDQVLVQRYIAAGSGRLMTKSLIFSAFLQIPVMVLLYLLGLGFYAYYHVPEHSALLASLNSLVAGTGDNTNMVMPHFIRHVLPSGLAGLVFAGLFAATMSVFSSGLNSLSTVTCVDFIQRLRRPSAVSEELTLASARWVTFAWGVVVTLASVGVYYCTMGSVVEAAVAVVGFFSGPLLGMFLLGMFSRRANSAGAILGALAGFAFALLSANRVSFVWYAVTGCIPTVLLGYVFSFLVPVLPNPEIDSMTIWGRDRKNAP
jgi:sodium-coupled monocarboxylate transporter 8/12